ncbi:MAG TPA: NAD(P)/FAD-dependent oxidoreductase [Candidatus Kapabacteria bacterium]|nr:NAD(P)/FAD-dependent oxidoreductase [Candidatus Kapabacteria bacterium]
MPNSPDLPHIVIIGAGFGGLNAALHLRNAPCRVTVVDKNNHHLFQPLLYQVATAGLSPGDIAAPIRHVLRRAANTEVLMAEVTGIDAERKQVLLAEGNPISYDYLILATGARHSYFGHEEWAPFAPGLKSIADATGIRRRILRAYEEAELERAPSKRAMLLTIVIVGAGPTGVEMAGSIAELARLALKNEFRNFDPASTRVILAEAGPRILPGFPESLSHAARKKLEQLGIEVRTASRVEKISAHSVRMNGNDVSASTVIWAAGVEASAAGTWLGVKTDRAGRVPVNQYLQVELRSEIYVIGDTALAMDTNGEPLPGLAPVAIQQGIYVARQLSRVLEHHSAGKPFHYRDKGTLATIGRSFAIAHIWKLRITGLFAWLLWVFVHIMYLIGFRNRAVVMLDWMWAYISYQRAVRLIVEEKN